MSFHVTFQGKCHNKFMKDFMSNYILCKRVQRGTFEVNSERGSAQTSLFFHILMKRPQNRHFFSSVPKVGKNRKLLYNFIFSFVVANKFCCCIACHWIKDN